MPDRISDSEGTQIARSEAGPKKDNATSTTPQPENGNGNGHKSDFLLRKVIVFTLCGYLLLSAVLIAALVGMGKQIPPEISLMSSAAMGTLAGVMSPNLRR